jgi:3-hydroxybutyryl-CoA dehydratase
MEFDIGHTVQESKLFSQEDLNAFARLSGDDNPIHVDPAFSARTRFGRTVAHGMLLYSTICGLLGRHFSGATQLEQSLKFPAPTFVGESITILAEVVEVMADRHRARMRITMKNSAGQPTCEGETLLGWQNGEAA